MQIRCDGFPHRCLRQQATTRLSVSNILHGELPFVSITTPKPTQLLDDASFLQAYAVRNLQYQSVYAAIATAIPRAEEGMAILSFNTIERAQGREREGRTWK